MRICFFVILLATSSVVTADLRIASITPSGEEVPALHQLVLEFDQAMVPLGITQAAPKIRITPELACQWRWLTDRTLACQLPEDAGLQPATAYRLRANADAFTSLNGSHLSTPLDHRFATTRPRITRARIVDWEGPGRPLVRLQFNQPVTEKSVNRHITFETAQDRTVAIAIPDETPPPKRVWLVQPRGSLPEDEHVVLAAAAGLRSVEGALASQHQPELLEFSTFPSFRAIGVRCYTESGQQLEIRPQSQQTSSCDPDYGAVLLVTTPALAQNSSEAIDVRPATKPSQWYGYQPQLTRWVHHQQNNLYVVHFADQLQPATEYQLAVRKDLRDAFDRTLDTPAHITFRTGHRRPAAQIRHRFAVLEAGVDSEVPLYTTNISQIDVQYARWTALGRETKLSYSPDLPVATDRRLVNKLGVREMLDGKSGIVAGQFTPTPATSDNAHSRHFFAQVTPYQVHVKLGHFSGLVWVTHLRTGRPIANAEVTLYPGQPNALTQPDLRNNSTFQVRTDANGVAELPGISNIDPQLEGWQWRCQQQRSCDRWMVHVKGDAGLALLPLTYDFDVSLWRTTKEPIYENARRRFGHIHAWGFTPQGIYRPGDDVALKLYLRDQDDNGYRTAPSGPYTVKVIDPKGNEWLSATDQTLNPFGSISLHRTLPSGASMGWYQVNVHADFLPNPIAAFRFLVTDFTPSPFKVRTQLSGSHFDAGDEVVVDTEATLHSGGAYGDARVDVQVVLAPRRFQASTFAEYQFGRVQLPETANLLQTDGRLNSAGLHTIEVAIGDQEILHGRLIARASVQDDRGSAVVHSQTAEFTAVDRIVGLKRDDWVLTAGRQGRFASVVVNPQGEAKEDHALLLRFERKVTNSAKVRGAGNVFETRYTESWVPAGECSLVKPGDCYFTPELAGPHRVTAQLATAQRPEFNTEMHFWVAGPGYVTWRDESDISVELIPERDEYQVGETAKILVKNPLPGHRALITLERYGVLKQWTTTLRESTEILEIPIEANFAPGAYLSVLIHAPRVAAPPTEPGRIDLAKPVYRIGYTKLNIVAPDTRLKTRLTTDAQIYKPRSEVQLFVQGEANTEHAIVVLDEAVLELITGGSKHFDPYQGFYRLDGLDVRNYNLLTQLVGRTKFDTKGANAGGDGGAELALRELFDHVAYFNPSVITSDTGTAELRFHLPDNLTGWRVLAISVDSARRFGLSETRFITNQPTELRPLMPNQLTVGDQFDAGFAVYNRTAQARELSVTATVQGDDRVLAPISLPPNARTNVYFPVIATQEGNLTISLSVADAHGRDALEHRLSVIQRTYKETAAQYGQAKSGDVTIPVQLPANANDANLGLAFTPSLIGSLDGAFTYMRDYPYACWEQRLSKATMAKHYLELASFTSDTFRWPDAVRLPERVLSDAASFQAPNGGMVYFVPDNRRVSPYLSAFTALAFQWLGGAPASVEQKLHAYLQTLLKDAGSEQNAVRAVALHALAKAGYDQDRELRRQIENLAELDAFAVAHLIQAAEYVGTQPQRETLIAALLSRANRTSGGLSFPSYASTEANRYLLHSTQRTSCAALSALATLKQPTLSQQNLATDLTRSVRSIRGDKAYWGNTQDNLYCTRALADYAGAFERAPTDMTVAVTLDNEPLATLNVHHDRSTPQRVATTLTSTSANLRFETKGQGSAFYEALVSYERPIPELGVRSGFDLKRQYSVWDGKEWQPLQPGATLTRGQNVRVDLTILAPGERFYVVVDDPVPGLLEPVNSALATQAHVDDLLAPHRTRAHRASEPFYHSELGHQAVRFYADRLAAGTYHLHYTARVVATGSFATHPTRAEEMYTPHVFGTTPTTTLRAQ